MIPAGPQLGKLRRIDARAVWKNEAEDFTPWVRARWKGEEEMPGSRYPGEPEEPTPDEVENAVVLAQAVSDAIRARLPPEARP